MDHFNQQYPAAVNLPLPTATPNEQAIKRQAELGDLYGCIKSLRKPSTFRVQLFVDQQHAAASVLLPVATLAPDSQAQLVLEQRLNGAQHFDHKLEYVPEEWYVPEEEVCASNLDGAETRINGKNQAPEPEVLLADVQAQQLSGLPHYSCKVLEDLLGNTETSPAPDESFDRIIALEPEVIVPDSPENDASAWSPWRRGASQDVLVPMTAEEVADPPPPVDNTEGTQLALAVVATQPVVAVLHGEVPTGVAQVSKPKPAPKRKHECGECFQPYASASALARHVLTHAPCTCVDGSCAKHPFPCTTCGQRFSQTANLQSHINEMHLLVT